MTAKNILLDSAVPPAVLEDLFGVTERRIQQLVEEGVVVRLAHGKYALRESITSYVTYLRESMQNQPVSDAEKVQRLRHAKYKADMAELDLRERTGELVNRKQERRLAFVLARNLRAAMEHMAVRLAPVMAAESDQHKTHNLMMAEVKSALTATIEANQEISLDFSQQTHNEVSRETTA